MVRSLRGRLVVLLLLLIVAASAAAALMFGLFRQSAAQAAQAQAEIGRACEAIQGAYQLFSADRRGPPGGSSADDETLRRDLTAVVQRALKVVCVKFCKRRSFGLG
jgi:type II secretory pathway pseudopilin PulG